MKNKLRRLPMKKLLQTTLLFALAFCAGRLAAQVVEYNRPPEAVTTSADGTGDLVSRARARCLWEMPPQTI